MTTTPTATTTATTRKTAAAGRRPARLLGVAALLLAGALAGCEEEVTYGYIQGDVSFGASVPDELLMQVDGCNVAVAGARDYSTTLRGCGLGRTPRELGTFDFSTTAGSGMLTFSVTAVDVNFRPLATASANLTLGPAMPSRLAFVLAPTPQGLMAIDGGARPDAGAAPDAGSGSSPAPDAASD
jgi:hypothetical protein